MHHSSSSSKIKNLRSKNQTTMLTALTVLVASLFATAVLPTLLLRYVYAGELFERPVLLEYIPVASFVLGMGYFLVSVIGNAMRALRINQLEKQMKMENDSCNCCGDGCGCGDCADCDISHGHGETMNNTESLAEALMKKEKPVKKKAKKSKTSKK